MKQKFNFNAWLKDRDEALFSFDIDKITSYCIKYGAPIPPRNTPNREKIILGGAAKAVLQIKTAPEEIKAKARQILDEYKFSYDIFGIDERQESKARRALMPQINVIYCRDCKKYRPIPDSDYGQCTRLLGTNNRYTVEKQTDFCSHAEQKYDDISDIVDNAQHTSSGLLEEI